MVSYGFYPEAAEEYLAATQYYLENASELIAAAFVVEVEGNSTRANGTHRMGDH